MSENSNSTPGQPIQFVKSVPGFPTQVHDYPQLCGLCGCVNTAHTPDHCKNCNHQHAYVRTDVLTCTLLANIDDKLDRIGRMMSAAIRNAGLDQDSKVVRLH